MAEPHRLAGGRDGSAPARPVPIEGSNSPFLLIRMGRGVVYLRFLQDDFFPKVDESEARENLYDQNGLRGVSGYSQQEVAKVRDRSELLGGVRCFILMPFESQIRSGLASAGSPIRFAGEKKEAAAWATSRILN